VVNGECRVVYALYALRGCTLSCMTVPNNGIIITPDQSRSRAKQAAHQSQEASNAPEPRSKKQAANQARHCLAEA
jgi:hypothetical protein